MPLPIAPETRDLQFLRPSWREDLHLRESRAVYDATDRLDGDTRLLRTSDR